MVTVAPQHGAPLSEKRPMVTAGMSSRENIRQPREEEKSHGPSMQFPPSPTVRRVTAAAELKHAVNVAATIAHQDIFWRDARCLPSLSENSGCDMPLCQQLRLVNECDTPVGRALLCREPADPQHRPPWTFNGNIVTIAIWKRFQIYRSPAAWWCVIR